MPVLIPLFINQVIMKVTLRYQSVDHLFLRWAIFQAAKVAVIHDPVFNAYYEKKKSEGKALPNNSLDTVTQGNYLELWCI